MKMFFKKQKKQAGMTLIEMLMVIGIGTLIIVGGFLLFGRASEQSKANQMIKDYSAIKSAVTSVYSQQPSYGDATSDITMTIAQSGALPKSLLTLTGGIPMGITSAYGTVTLNVADDPAQWKAKFAGTKMPKSVCNMFITGVLRTAKQIDVGTTQLSSTSSPADINSACGGASVGDIFGSDITVTSD